MRFNLKSLFVVIALSGLAGAYLEKQYLGTETSTAKVTDRIVTRIRDVVSPDGTKRTDTVITERRDSVATMSKPVLTKDWLISVGTSLTVPNYYQLNVNRRILGPVYLGGWLTTEKSGGVSLGLEF